MSTFVSRDMAPAASTFDMYSNNIDAKTTGLPLNAKIIYIQYVVTEIIKTKIYVQVWACSLNNAKEPKQIILSCQKVNNVSYKLVR